MNNIYNDCFYKSVNNMNRHCVYDWKDLIFEEINEFPDMYKILNEKLSYEYENYIIYPKMQNLFNAFVLCPLDKYKCCCCGQDPYINPNEAMGLSFSVPNNVKIPPSLKNILIEVKDDIGFTNIKQGDLTYWAQQGVLLINTVLSVRESCSNSHKDLWGDFILHILLRANAYCQQPISYILWGNQSKRIGKELESQNIKFARLFLYSPHPSPLSAYRGFFGSKPFSKTNDFLLQNNSLPILW